MTRLSEPFPSLESATGFSLLSSLSEDIHHWIISEHPPNLNENRYQRIYGRQSELEKGLLGPDLIPYHFQRMPFVPSLELEGKKEFNILWIAQNISEL